MVTDHQIQKAKKETDHINKNENVNKKGVSLHLECNSELNIYFGISESKQISKTYKNTRKIIHIVLYFIALCITFAYKNNATF